MKDKIFLKFISVNKCPKPLMDKIIPALLYILAAKPPKIKDFGEAI